MTISALFDIIISEITVTVPRWRDQQRLIGCTSCNSAFVWNLHQSFWIVDSGHSQYQIMRGKSSLTNLISSYDKVAHWIDHSILQDRISHLQPDKYKILWVNSQLMGQAQRVGINRVTSSCCPLTNEVHQGSIHGVSSSVRFPKWSGHRTQTQINKVHRQHKIERNLWFPEEWIGLAERSQQIRGLDNHQPH